MIGRDDFDRSTVDLPSEIFNSHLRGRNHSGAKTDRENARHIGQHTDLDLVSGDLRMGGARDEHCGHDKPYRSAHTGFPPLGGLNRAR